MSLFQLPRRLMSPTRIAVMLPVFSCCHLQRRCCHHSLTSNRKKVEESSAKPPKPSDDARVLMDDKSNVLEDSEKSSYRINAEIPAGGVACSLHHMTNSTHRFSASGLHWVDLEGLPGGRAQCWSDADYATALRRVLVKQHGVPEVVWREISRTVLLPQVTFSDDGNVACFVVRTAKAEAVSSGNSAHGMSAAGAAVGAAVSGSSSSHHDEHRRRIFLSSVLQPPSEGNGSAGGGGDGPSARRSFVMMMGGQQRARSSSAATSSIKKVAESPFSLSGLLRPSSKVVERKTTSGADGNSTMQQQDAGGGGGERVVVEDDADNAREDISAEEEAALDQGNSNDDDGDVVERSGGVTPTLPAPTAVNDQVVFQTIQTLTLRVTVFVFRKENKIITCHRQMHPLFTALHSEWESSQKQANQRGGAGAMNMNRFLSRFVTEVAMSFQHAERHRTIEIDGIEKALFSNGNRRSGGSEEAVGAGGDGCFDAVLHRLYMLSREASAYQRTLKPLLKTYDDLASGLELPIGGRYQVKQSIKASTAMCDGLREQTQALLSLQFSVAAYRLEDLMRLLTVYSTVFIPLEFLACVFGMNFIGLPLVGSDYGILVVAVLMGLTGCTTTWWLRRSFM